jgi:hypothetical protein
MKKKECQIKRNWGSDIIPKEEWIDPSKRYTCDGCEVRYITIALNGMEYSDREVTYPVNGIIVRNKKDKISYVTKNWTLNGKHSIAFEEHLYDLKEVK